MGGIAYQRDGGLGVGQGRGLIRDKYWGFIRSDQTDRPTRNGCPELVLGHHRDPLPDRQTTWHGLRHRLGVETEYRIRQNVFLGLDILEDFLSFSSLES